MQVVIKTTFHFSQMGTWRTGTNFPMANYLIGSLQTNIKYSTRFVDSCLPLLFGYLSDPGGQKYLKILILVRSYNTQGKVH